MIRIGIITYALERPLTGIGRYTVEFVRALMQLSGSSTEIVLITAGGSGPLAELGLQEVNLAGSKLAPALLSLGALQIPSIAHRLKLDIIHDTSGITPFAAGAASAKRVTTLYDVIPLSYPGISTRWDTLVYQHWLPFMLPRIDATLTISEHSKHEIMHHMRVPAEKVHNISGGVSELYQPSSVSRLEEMRQKYTLPEHYILFVGSLQKRKNFQRVLQAYALLSESLPHQLIVVGAEQFQADEIMSTGEYSHLQNRVRFIGYVDGYAVNTDLPSLYGAADLFVFPSLYEGFGLPVLEAMSCGTPVVTSNVSSLPEIAGDAALIVDPYNVEAIAAAMRHLLVDSSAREQISIRGLNRVRQFKWQAVAERALSAYQQLVAR